MSERTIHQTVAQTLALLALAKHRGDDIRVVFDAIPQTREALQASQNGR